MNKTIYLREEEGPIWDRARELAGEKLSPVIVDALKRFITENAAKAKGFERIEVSFNDSDANWIPKIKAFHGRWIFSPTKPVELTDEEGQMVCRYAVAITAKGAAVVYSWKTNQRGRFEDRFRVFDSLEFAAKDEDANYAVRKAIEAIGVPVEELDI